MTDHNKNRYRNETQQRVLSTLKILIAHSADGIPPGQIATALETLASNTTRDLANLEIAGLARQRHGRWFPLV